MAKINGNDFVITAATTDGGTQEMFLHSNSASISYTDAVIDVTTKDNNSTSEYITGRKTGTISFAGLMDYSGGAANTLNTVDLFDGIQAGTVFHWAMSGDDTVGAGRVTYSGQMIQTQFDQSGDSDAAGAYSGSGQISGPITKVVAT